MMSIGRVVLAGLGVAAVGAASWARKDFAAWRALGPGGLPHTLPGWWKMTRLRMRMGDTLSIDRFAKRMGKDGDHATLDGLPERPLTRPIIAPHPIPHRQIDQHIPEALRQPLKDAFDSTVAAAPQMLSYAQSYFEKHNEAITLDVGCRHQPDACATCGEIAHIHPSDGSMHMTLAPSDAREVIDKGWGELHGLSGVALGVPSTYTLIYAPQTAKDIAVIAQILDASVAYMSWNSKQ